MEDLEALLGRLREKLSEQSWPDVYFFKFIIPTDNEKIGMIYAMFDDSADIQLHESNSNKYTSVSIKTVMIDVESILDIYRKASKIEGIISL